MFSNYKIREQCSLYQDYTYYKSLMCFINVLYVICGVEIMKIYFHILHFVMFIAGVEFPRLAS